MKLAFYVENGREQIVLTPTDEFETSMLEKLHDGSREFTVKKGAFYATRGGWTRQAKADPYIAGFSSSSDDDESTIIVLGKKEVAA